MTDAMADIGPVNTLSARDLVILARAVRYEATLALDCAEPGRAHNPQRAVSALKKINALTAGLARQGVEG